LLYTDTRHALDFLIAQRSEEQAASSERMAIASHRLNLLVAFFFPIATLAGIFGMNLTSGLEELSRDVGPILLVSILFCGLVAGLLLTLFVTVSGPKRSRSSRLARPPRAAPAARPTPKW